MLPHNLFEQCAACHRPWALFATNRHWFDD